MIEVRDSTLGSWRRVGLVDPLESRYRLGNLIQGQDYMVRVIARNREGESVPLQSEIFSLVPETSKSFFSSLLITNHKYVGEWLSLWVFGKC